MDDVSAVFLTPKEAAAEFGYSEQYLRALCRAGRLPWAEV